MIHNTFHKRTVRRFLAVVAAGVVLAGTGIASATRADAAPKFCDTQMYVHACATGHGGTTFYPTKKKDCDHETAGGEPGGGAPVGSGIAGGAA